MNSRRSLGHLEQVNVSLFIQKELQSMRRMEEFMLLKVETIEFKCLIQNSNSWWSLVSLFFCHYFIIQLLMNKQVTRHLMHQTLWASITQLVLQLIREMETLLFLTLETIKFKFLMTMVIFSPCLDQKEKAWFHLHLFFVYFRHTNNNN